MHIYTDIVVHLFFIESKKTLVHLMPLSTSLFSDYFASFFFEGRLFSFLVRRKATQEKRRSERSSSQIHMGEQTSVHHTTLHATLLSSAPGRLPQVSTIAASTTNVASSLLFLPPPSNHRSTLIYTPTSLCAIIHHHNHHQELRFLRSLITEYQIPCTSLA